MSEKNQRNLRTRLRSDTQPSHEALDRQVSQFDLTTRSGFARFLGMQSGALRSLVPVAGRGATKNAMCDLLARANADLETIGADAGAPAHDIAPLHPAAIDYVIAGSRLGTQVLRRRWLTAKDPDLRQANAYFSAPGYIDLWKGFCTWSETLSDVGPKADQIVADTDVIFRLYQTCARGQNVTKGAVNA